MVSGGKEGTSAHRYAGIKEHRVAVISLGAMDPGVGSSVPKPTSKYIGGPKSAPISAHSLQQKNKTRGGIKRLFEKKLRGQKWKQIFSQKYAESLV